MCPLEEYYEGDSAFSNLANATGDSWKNSEIQLELLKLVNNDLDMAKIIYYTHTDLCLDWMNNKIPVLEYLTPLDCLKSEILIKRLKVCLMRSPS